MPKNQMKIKDLHVEYVIVHRKVKYPRLEIKTDILYVILPENHNNAFDLIKKHESWIYNKLSHVKLAQNRSRSKELNLKRTNEEFKELIALSVENYSQKMNVKVNQIKFRRMKSRWGSCSSNGNVNFNLYLKFLPAHLIKYIVFHELSHLIEMGHNKRFWNMISTEFPDYKNLEDELFVYWLKVKEYKGI